MIGQIPETGITLMIDGIGQIRAARARRAMDEIGLRLTHDSGSAVKLDVLLGTLMAQREAPRSAGFEAAQVPMASVAHGSKDVVAGFKAARNPHPH
jgi:hypothetical protein